MCDIPSDTKQSTMDKDCSEAGTSDNRDSGYGPSTNNQQSTTGSSSRGCFSLENSLPSSGSETSLRSKHSKARAAAAAAAAAAGGAPGDSAPSSASASEKPGSRLMPPSAANSDLAYDSKSSEESSQAALQKEAYQHVMSYIRKIVEWEKGSNQARVSAADGPDDADVPAAKASAAQRLEVLVSLRKGTVVETSGTITELLGYPADMWVGRSFIDFVYPRDRAAFTSSISTMGVDVDGRLSSKDNATSCQLFCRLRHYRGLKSVGFNVVSRTHIYKPFQVRIIFGDDKMEPSAGEGPCFLVVAEVLQSAYRTTADGVDEAYRNIAFSMRHTASCQVDQYDSQAIALLGHLPQDVIGHSIVEFFHPEDLPAIKDVYRRVTQRTGVPFRSRPYRLRAHNGCYVGMETDWSCFVNPWSSKIEAVICKHRVIKAPKNTNVFEEDEDKSSECVEKLMLSNSHRVDIENILSKSVAPSNSRISCTAQRRKRLVALMESLITELETVEQPPTPDRETSISVPKDVSPHTSERASPAPVSVTPPNYFQLNYKETIDRFFQSHPKTTIGSSDESDSRNDCSGPNKLSAGALCAGPGAGPSGLVGSQLLSAPSAGDVHHPQQQADAAASASYHHQPLTQAMLDRHNADMEKNMRQSHGTKKLGGYDKSKHAKRSCYPEHTKDTDEFEQERRRMMRDTPTWPTPNVFWPPFSAYHPGPHLTPPDTGYGYWLLDPAAAAAAAAQAAVAPMQPGFVVQPAARPMLMGPMPSVSGRAAATLAHPAALHFPRAAAAAHRRDAKVSPPRAEGVSSGDQSADCAAATSESLQKMNLDGDEDMSSKDKEESDLSVSDSSISSLPKDLDASGDSYGTGWPNSSDGNNQAASEMDDSEQPGPSCGVGARPTRRPVLMDPPWLTGVTLSADLTYRYQMEPRNMEEVLEQDRQTLLNMPQPAMLSEQLNQLYQDLETAGAPSVINLEEREGTSGSSDDSAAMLGKRMKRSRRVREYDRLTIVFEEDSPIPPPDLPTYHQLLQST